MAELTFFHGPMNSAKSALALQWRHAARAAGRSCLLFTRHDRAGDAAITSRVGLSAPATVITDDLDLHTHVGHLVTSHQPVDEIIIDEAQFLSAAQVEQCVRIVDRLGIDVLALGLLTDFRSQLFPGSARLVELADRLERLQVAARCWCGLRGNFNARVIDGTIQREGAQVVVGDVGTPVGYEVLCRHHFIDGQTSAQADVCHLPA